MIWQIRIKFHDIIPSSRIVPLQMPGFVGLIDNKI